MLTSKLLCTKQKLFLRRLQSEETTEKSVMLRKKTIDCLDRKRGRIHTWNASARTHMYIYPQNEYNLFGNFGFHVHNDQRTCVSVHTSFAIRERGHPYKSRDSNQYLPPPTYTRHNPTSYPTISHSLFVAVYFVRLLCPHMTPRCMMMNWLRTSCLHTGAPSNRPSMVPTAHDAMPRD